MMKTFILLVTTLMALGGVYEPASAALTSEDEGAVVHSMLSGDIVLLDELATVGAVDISSHSLANAANEGQKPLALQCTCHALNPRYESTCRYLPIAQCTRVGNITCVPRCEY